MPFARCFVELWRNHPLWIVGPTHRRWAIDEQPVEALGPCRPDKALRERVRSGRMDRDEGDRGADLS